MEDALRSRSARELPATREAADVPTRSPLLCLIRNNISIAFAFLQLAQTSLRLNHPTSEAMLVKAEKAYQKSAGYVGLLPNDDRISALFDLGRLRAALDEFYSSHYKSE